jgi:hypothetical protein
MGWFDLAKNWVYVIDKDGTENNVMNTDVLDNDDIKWIKDNWVKKSTDRIECRAANGEVLKVVNV